MDQILSFIMAHIISISIVMVPLLYIMLRDLVLFFRKKQALKQFEQTLQEKQAAIDYLVGQLDENRKELSETFNKISSLESSSEAKQMKATQTPPNQPDLKNPTSSQSNATTNQPLTPNTDTASSSSSPSDETKDS